MRKVSSTHTARFQSIARVMSRNYGVDVKLGGNQAKTDGKTIWLPGNSDFLSEDGQDRAHALCDHERLHVMEEMEATEIREGRVQAPKHKFFVAKGIRGRGPLGWRSPLEILKDIGGEGNRRAMMMNVFEDIRIEEKAQKSLESGTVENLHRMNAQLAEKFKSGDFWSTIGKLIIFASRALPVKANANHRRFVAALAPEIRDSRLAVTPEDSLVLADRAIKRIEGLHDEIDANSNNGDGGDAPGRPTGSKNTKGGSGRRGKDRQRKRDNASDGSDIKGGGGGSGEGDGDGKKTKGGVGGFDDCGEGIEDEEGEPSTEVEPPKEGAGLEASDFNGIDEEPDSTDLVDEVRKVLEEESTSESKSNNRYSVARDVKALDRFIVKQNYSPLNEADLASKYKALQNEVGEQTAAMQRRLRRKLTAKAQTFVSGDRASGELDSSVLSTLLTGNKRVHCERQKSTATNTAVLLMLDLSGSTRHSDRIGTPAFYIQRTTIALAEALHGLRIPLEILGYHTTRIVKDSFIEAAKGEHSRFCPLDIVIFKSFSEALPKVRTRLAVMNGHGGNVDGESIVLGAERLMKRREQRKIMFVISDGMPAEIGSTHLKLGAHLSESVKQITKAGVELHGIGAGTGAPGKYYCKENGSSFEAVLEMSKLPDTMMRLLDSKLTK